MLEASERFLGKETVQIDTIGAELRIPNNERR